MPLRISCTDGEPCSAHAVAEELVTEMPASSWPSVAPPRSTSSVSWLAAHGGVCGVGDDVAVSVAGSVADDVVGVLSVVALPVVDDAFVRGAGVIGIESVEAVDDGVAADDGIAEDDCGEDGAAGDVVGGGIGDDWSLPVLHAASSVQLTSISPAAVAANRRVTCRS